MQWFAWKILPDFLGQRLNASLNSASRNQHSDALSRRSVTLLSGFLAFRHLFLERGTETLAHALAAGKAHV